MQDGTLIAKNRDSVYTPQKLQIVPPALQFIQWHNNPYKHKNHFYALTYGNEISFGINPSGLTVIEEDSMIPKSKNGQHERRFLQPELGTSASMTMYGLLQNFNSVDEIIPFINKIFEFAAPDFYQISDGKKILTVEVDFAKNNQTKTRKFKYHIYNKPKTFFVHTNTYLSSQFLADNNLSNVDKYSVLGANKRYTTTKNFIQRNLNSFNVKKSANWLLNTKSAIKNPKHPNWCLNTSIFRSNLESFNTVDMNNIPGNHKIYGSIASVVVHNTGNPKTSKVYIRLLDSIKVDKKKKQQIINYRDFQTSIADLFITQSSARKFKTHQFTRQLPQNSSCN